MTKLKLNTFRGLTQTAHVRICDKVVKLREERDLFSRFLIIQGSRPGRVPKIEDTIGHYEMSVVPRSLFATDGSLLIPKDKYKMMNAIKEVKDEHPPPNSSVSYFLRNRSEENSYSLGPLLSTFLHK